MVQKTIGVKEFHKNFLKIAAKARRGHSFLVMRRNMPLFRVEPPAPKKPKFTLKDFEKIKFRDGGDPNLSKNIDKIVYGV